MKMPSQECGRLVGRVQRHMPNDTRDPIGAIIHFYVRKPSDSSWIRAGKSETGHSFKDHFSHVLTAAMVWRTIAIDLPEFSSSLWELLAAIWTRKRRPRRKWWLDRCGPARPACWDGAARGGGAGEGRASPGDGGGAGDTSRLQAEAAVQGSALSAVATAG